MRRFWIVLLAVMFATVSMAAQQKAGGEPKEKKEAAARQLHWSGTIVTLAKDKSLLTIKTTNGSMRIVQYDSSTHWTKGTAPADISAFKDGERVLCLGTYDKKSGHLMATRIDLRAQK